jgi:hypothetical protein
VIYAESKGEIKGHELSTTGRRFGLVFISIRAGWQSLHSLGLLVSLKGDTMPDSIGDNIEEEIGDNIDHIISDSVAHYLDDSMIDNMSDILQEIKLFSSMNYRSKATSEYLLAEALCE